jgi:hypothetical protein
MDSLATTGRALERQLGFYEEEAESWKSDHDRAMDCIDIQEVLSLGLYVFSRIRNIENQWTESLRDRGAVPRKEDAERLSHWFRLWLKVCDELIQDIKSLAQDGYQVESAREFGEACLYARSAVSFNLDRLYSAKVTGTGKTTGELRDELQGRLGN